MKNQITMRHIEAFRAVMLAGSVVGAAKLLNVTQPGVSRTIAHLELRLGYALFERRGRRLLPTHEAEALYREVEQIYIGIDRIGQIAQDIGLHRAGALRVASLPALSHWLVPQAIARFLEGRPNVSLFTQSLGSRQIAEAVATRQFDVGLVELPLTRAGIEVHPLEPAPTVAVVPASHRLASRSKLTLQDLNGERMVLLSAHSYLRYRIDDAFADAGVTPHAIVETANSTMACALAAAGVGITLVSRWAVKSFPPGDIAVLPIEADLASRYAVVYPEGLHQNSLSHDFHDSVKTVIGAHARGRRAV